jgi:hypothetical protein
LVASLVLVAITLVACAPSVFQPAGQRSSGLVQPPPAPGMTLDGHLRLV